MTLIRVGKHVVNIAAITVVLLDFEQPDAKADAMTSWVRIVFDNAIYVGFEADSPEGKALAWWFTEGQEPYFWSRPLDIVAAHAEALSHRTKP